MSLSNYSNQYTLIKREGHKRPPPTFGAPTLVWHIGVWPKKEHDSSDTKPTVEFTLDYPPNGGSAFKTVQNHKNRPYREALIETRKKGKDFVESINAFLADLQKDNRRIASSVEQFKWIKYDPKKSFEILDHESIGFTLWWSDTGVVSGNQFPGEDAIRVRVQVEAHIDHFTFSFFIDASKLWVSTSGSVGRIYNLLDCTGKGTRRTSIFQAIENIRSICDARTQTAIVNNDLLPEELDDLTAGGNSASLLKNASEFLYERIWNEFCSSFEFNRSNIAGEKGEIFAEFRGLVHATRQGCESDPALASNYGKGPLARFVHHRADTSEANRVLKAYWPFVRRMTPYADYREFVACGVMDWRAIYVTTLGSQDEFDPRDESESRGVEVEKGHLIEPLTFAEFVKEREDRNLRSAAGEIEEPQPIRYLFLTKCDPDRRQIGRIVERINALGTMRLFALKDVDAIREASLHIRMRGQHLDEVMKAWSDGRDKIQTEVERLYKGGSFKGTKNTEIEEKDKYLNNMLTDLTQFVEQDLIEINAEMETLGDNAVGGLPYTINRSRYFITEFLNLIKTIKAGNIDGWVSYTSFVQRGLKPSFDFIENTGTRLRALRDRLQAVTESIQTSAVQIQTAATRRNTDTLREIANTWEKTNRLLKFIAIVGLAWTTMTALWNFGARDIAQFAICKYVVAPNFPEDGPKLCKIDYFKDIQISPRR